MGTEALSSFRDPSGTVIHIAGRVLRRVSASAIAEIQEFLQSQVAAELTDEGKLIPTEQIADDDAHQHVTRHEPGLLEAFGSGGCIFEHERIWFPSYVYEWPAEMLYAAALLTLDVAERALAGGFGLKDATPYNVLFRGPNPVFVDLLSFERRSAGDFIWLPYGQFVRMFLLPLVMHKRFGVGLDQLFTTRAHGLEPEEVYAQHGWLQRLAPPVLTEVSLPTWLSKRGKASQPALYQPRTISNPEKAQFILRAQLRRLRRALKRAAPDPSRRSHWASYMSSYSYSEQEFQDKHHFIEEAVAEARPRTVLDIGCNAGHFSTIAARGGARVVGVDMDAAAVASAWHRASANKLDILPLVVNIARPTPPTGWRNSEYPSFLSRAAGAFDLVMMLATLHHLLVTERIPLNEIIDLVSELTASYAVIEYVAKEDPMFGQIVRGRAKLHESFTRDVFEAACFKRFSIVRAQPVKTNLRWLYLLKKNKP